MKKRLLKLGMSIFKPYGRNGLFLIAERFSCQLNGTKAEKIKVLVCVFTCKCVNKI